MELQPRLLRNNSIEWKEDAATLNAAYHKAKDGQSRQRLHAMWLLRQGKSLSETADLLDVHYRTVQEWVSWYRQGGIEAILARRHGGSRAHPRRLSKEQEAELKAKADAGEIYRIEDGVRWAQEEHQVEYTYWGMRHVFARLRLRPKVPRPRNPKASGSEQEAWKKGGLTAELQVAGCKNKEGIFWSDEMRVGLIGTVRRVWASVGVKVVQLLEYKYEWSYLNLAVNGLTGLLLWDWTPNMKGVSIAPVVEAWSEQGVDAVVWDRARGHRGPAFENCSVARIEQPPYSPELNPAERVFEYLRGRIEGTVYGTIANKQRAVEQELHKLASNPDAVKSTRWMAVDSRFPLHFHMNSFMALDMAAGISCRLIAV